MTRQPSNKPLIKEWLNPNFGYFYTIKKRLYSGATRYQKIRFVDTSEFGKMLVLDGITQVSEKKDYQYHEPMVHPAMTAHPRPRTVLVVGGGDGGILREVLKYAAVEHVDLAELDSTVIRFSRKYLSPMIHHALDDPRVSIHVVDGRQFVAQNPGRYDVIIMDMTDPFGPSKMLYTRDFFSLIKKAFRNAHGVFAMHSESPVTRPDAFASICATLRTSFTHVCPLFPYIQMYATLWSISICSDKADLSALSSAAVSRRLRRRGIRDLRMYDGKVHEAMQVPYPFISETMRTRGRIITDASPDFPDDFLEE
jgi:spermidine synthase